MQLLIFSTPLFNFAEQAVYNLVNQVTLHMNHVNRFGVPFVTLIPWSRHAGCLLLRQSPAFVRPRFYR